MQTVKLKLVTIIAEAVLEHFLLDDLKRLGAKGYTIGDVRGEGTRGLRSSDIESNLKLETVVSAAVADKILEHLAKRYFTNYALIAYVTDVEVVRGDKYV
jgi:nitrogen regulatory protein P-II 2